MSGAARSGRDLDAVVEEFAAACRLGEGPKVEEWVARHPEFAEDLAELLPAVMALEDGRFLSTARADSGISSEVAAPEQLGEYRLVRELGRGGMGIVYEALDTSLGRRVALKILPALDRAGAAERARFRREAEVASRLDHPGICAVHRAGIEGDVPYLVMRYVEGETLAAVYARRRREGRLPSTRAEIEAVVAPILGVARAIEVAHREGIIHRDLKPQNIMIDPRGEPVILDFGLARATGQATRTLTRAGAICGTPSYLAPEAIRGEAAARAVGVDLYALGATLFEGLTHRRPFDAPTLDALYRAILHDPVPDPRSLNPAIGRDLAAVVLAALEKEPERRYLSAAALADDLQALLDGRPVGVQPPSFVGRVSRWARREKPQALLVAVLVLVVPLLAASLGFLGAKLPQIRRAEKDEVLARIESLLSKGYRAIGHGDDLATAASFEEALHLDPESLEAHVGLAATHLGALRPDRTLAVLDSRPGLDASCPPLRKLRATALRFLQRETEAQALGTVAAPASAIEHFVFGLHDLTLGHRGDAAAMRAAVLHFRRAVSLSPVARPYFLGMLAHAAMHAGDEAAARESADLLVALWPDDPGSWGQRALGLRRVDPKAAEAAARRALELDPGSTQALDLVGDALLHQERFDEAVAVYRDLVDKRPGFWLWQHTLGFAYRKAGRLPEARTAAEHAVRLGPNQGAALRELGAVAWAEGGLEEAARHYQAACEVEPGSVEGWNVYAVVLRALGRNDDALEAFEESLHREPTSVVALEGAGRIHLLADRVDEAVTALRAAVAAEPRHELAQGNLIVALSRNGDLDLAIRSARDALSVCPTSRTIRDHLRRLLAASGRLPELLVFLDGEQAGGADAGLAGSERAWALVALRRYEEALVAAEAVLLVDPKNAAVACFAGRAETELGRFDVALRRLEEAVPRLSGGPALDFRPAEWLADARAAAGLPPDFGSAGEGASPGPALLRRVRLLLAARRFAAALTLQRRLAEDGTPSFLAGQEDAMDDLGLLAAVGVLAASPDPAAAEVAVATLREIGSELRDRLDRAREASPVATPVERRRSWPRLHDPRLAPLRGEAKLRGLDDDDRRRWRLYWRDLEAFLTATAAASDPPRR